MSTRDKRERSPYKGNNNHNTNNASQRSRSHSPNYYASPQKKKMKKNVPRSRSRSSSKTLQLLIIPDSNKNVHCNSSSFATAKLPSQSHKSTDCKSSISSQSSSSLSSSAKLGKKKQQKQLPTILPYCSFNWESLKKKIDKSLNKNAEYLQKIEELQKMNDTLNNIKKANILEADSDENKNDDDPQQLSAKIIEMERNIKKIFSSVQRSLLGQDFMIKFNKNGEHNIFNFIHDTHHYPTKGISITTKRGLNVKQLIRWSMEVTASYSFLVELQSQGTDHPKWKEFMKEADNLYHSGKSDENARNLMVKSSKLIIKILQNANNKYNFDLSAIFKKIKMSFFRIYEPGQYEEQYKNEENEEDLQYSPVWITDAGIYGVSKNNMITKQSWNAKKLLLRYDDSSEMVETEENNDIPSQSISIEPIQPLQPLV